MKLTPEQAARKRFYERHKERLRAECRERHRRTRAARTVYGKRWRAENPEKMAQYRKRDRDKARERYWARKAAA